jgi:hypothetical protein
MIGIGFAIEENNFGHGKNRRHNRVYFGGIASFGKIGNALYKLSWHVFL